MTEYYTIRGCGSGIYEEKKSRFIGQAFPVTTHEEIREILSKVRGKYYDARHHCYAYVLGADRMDRKASDDGEPSGTAGLPILKVLDGAMAANVLVVVTRYFGWNRRSYKSVHGSCKGGGCGCRTCQNAGRRSPDFNDGLCFAGSGQLSSETERDCRHGFGIYRPCIHENNSSFS